MRVADMDSLREKIIRPEFDEKLVPLLLYRGSSSIGNIQRGWNFAITMMETDCQSFTDGHKLSMNPDFAHLVGPYRRVEYYAIRSLFGRLRDNPVVTDNVPGFTAYCHEVVGISYKITPISIYTNYPKCKTPWRIYEAGAKHKASSKPKRARINEVFYPFLIYAPTMGHEERRLTEIVNGAIPVELPPSLRADLAQDLLVELLAQKLPLDRLYDPKKRYLADVMAAHPLKYGAEQSLMAAV